MDEWVNKAWDKARGIETTDYNNNPIFIRASVEEVGQAVTRSYSKAKWSRDILGADIVPGQEGLFIFRLNGHSWTEILHHHTGQSVLEQDYTERLSHDLKTRVISYLVGDTAGVISYTLYDQGEAAETFTGVEEEVVEFSSTVRDITADSIENIWEFAHDFFVEQDALEPGIEPGYFLTNYYATSQEVRPGQKVKVCNPGFILVHAGNEVISAPGLERVDYVTLA